MFKLDLEKAEEPEIKLPTSVGPSKKQESLFWTLMLEKTPESPLDCREIQPVNPKRNQSWIFIGRIDAEAPILWPPDRKNWLLRKDPDAGKDWRQEEKGMTEDEMVGWHHWLDGHEFEQALGVGDGQGSLTWCSHGSCKESDMTERHTWTSGASLMVQWLSLCLPVQGARVQSLVREGRSDMLHGVATPASKTNKESSAPFFSIFRHLNFPCTLKFFFN